MAEKFVHGLWQHVFFWSGWAFTIAGTVAAVSIGWVGVLIALVGLAAAISFAHHKHRELANSEAEAAKLRNRLDEAEQKLKDLPIETLLRIQDLIAASSIRQVIDGLIRQAEYSGRMARFMEVIQPLNLRTFTFHAGAFYAVAKVDESRVNLFKAGDPFMLTVKNKSGLATDSAGMVVHQRDEKKGSVWFLINSFIGDEMAHLAALAEKKDVAGLTGYSVRPLFFVEGYDNLRIAEFAEFLRKLSDEMIRFEGFPK